MVAPAAGGWNQGSFLKFQMCAEDAWSISPEFLGLSTLSLFIAIVQSSQGSNRSGVFVWFLSFSPLRSNNLTSVGHNDLHSVRLIKF